MAFILPSCNDDFEAPSVVEIIEGEPASISIPTNIGDMQVKTRADMEAGRDMEINSIWVGLFHAGGNQMLADYKLFTENDKIGQIGTAETVFQTLDWETKSGSYYIVAVANVSGNNGVLYREDGTGVTTAKSLRRLLLEDVKDYEDFKNLAFIRGNGTFGAIDTPTGNLPMYGVYVAAGSHHAGLEPDEVEEFSLTPKYISPTKKGETLKLDGAIHFRRLVSQNNFNISYDTNNITNFEIVNARVVNVPVVAWLAERGDNTETGFVNAGDNVGIIGKAASTESNAPAAQVNYLLSSTIQPADITNNSDGSFSFDWWQLENRRTGEFSYLENGVTPQYSHREEERQQSTSGVAGKDDNGNDIYYRENLGVYKALCGESGDVTANNCATYLQLNVHMDMNSGNNNETKMVDAQYTIHLGYIGGDVEDYNCNRNTKYTYNVKVVDANKIEVEAKKQDEDYQNGAEGTVTIATTQYFESDAHYTAFNVELSNKERANADWQMRVYLSATRYIDISGSNVNTLQLNGTNIPEKYYNWIEFRQTTDANTLAPYKPIGGVSDADASSKNPKPFRLTDIKDLNNYPAYNASGNKDSNEFNEEIYYYTVFLNEYIYEDEYNSNTSANWAQYINLPARTFWLKVTEDRSIDQESVIIHSKYAFRQKAIQSFYSSTNPVTGIIMGMEHTNELSGIPLVMHGIATANYGNSNSTTSFSVTPAGGDALEMNYNYFSYENDGVDNVYNIQSSNTLSWSSYFTNFDNGPTPMISNGEYNGLVDVRNTGSFRSLYYSGLKDYTESRIVAEACLNRNRDLNGDGKIDKSELRWIVPDISQYIRLMMGSAAYSDPLISYNKIETNPWSSETDYENKVPYHYGSIDSNQLWAEEGISTAWLNNRQCPNPQEIRCIRYLGYDYSSGSFPTNFSLAVTKGSGNTLIFSYSDESTRTASTGELPVHKISGGGNYNRPATKMEYKSTDDEIRITSTEYSYFYRSLYSQYTNANWFTYLNTYNPCDKFNADDERGGWRLPNQVELVSMMDNGLLTRTYTSNNEVYNCNYLSCTQEYFGTRIMGADKDHGLAFDLNNQCYIKCVRDLE